VNCTTSGSKQIIVNADATGTNAEGAPGEANNVNITTVSCTTPIVFSKISAGPGGYHTCGIRASDSRVFCWGDNAFGDLGDGTNVQRRIPTLTTDSSAYAKISLGDLQACGIRTSGNRVLCWGSNYYGTLGDGTTADRWNPTLTTDASAYTKVSTGHIHTCGIRSDGRVLCWGYNGQGGLGDGTTTQRLTPTLTTDTSSYIDISVGSYNTCGVRADGRVLCWGSNTYGELGDGTTTQRLTPTLTTDTSSYTSVSTGTDQAGSYTHTCGLRSDGRVLCWGFNANGGLGDGTTTQRLNPTLTTDSSAYTKISVGDLHTCGIRTSDSRALCWGNNAAYGEVGDGVPPITNRLNPTLTNDSSAYIDVAGGYFHSCGVRAGGIALCWGYNQYGELGDGTTTGHRFPTFVSGLP
jgi:alpha-tubulin suppressor-like RCC1 family protein